MVYNVSCVVLPGVHIYAHSNTNRRAVKQSVCEKKARGSRLNGSNT